MLFEEFQDGCHGVTILAILNLCVIVIASHQVLAQSYLWSGRRCHLKNFKMAAMGYWNRTILAILNLCVTVMPPIKFQLNLLMVWEMLFEEFQDCRRGGHLGYRNRTILAILNLCVTVMPPIKFWLNPNYSLGGDVN